MTNEISVRQGKREVKDAERRKEFIERMERKLAGKKAAKQQQRQKLIQRLHRLREW